MLKDRPQKMNGDVVYPFVEFVFVLFCFTAYQPHRSFNAESN